MKKISTLFCAGVLMSTLCAGFAACNEPKDPEVQGEDVPFTVYSLTGESGEEFSARWVNLDYVEGKSTMLIINSDEELGKYVEGEYPPIDFLKKTVLVAYGPTPTELYKATVDNFSLMSDGNYQLDVTTLLYDTTRPDRWLIAMAIDKIKPESKVEINVKFPGTWPE